MLANKTRRNQILTTVFVLGGGLMILVLGLWATDPNKNRPSLDERKKRDKENVTKNYQINSHSVLSDSDNWISKSEDRLKSMEEQNSNLQKMITELKTQISDLSASKGVDLNLVTDSVGHEQSSILKDINTKLPPPNFDAPKVGLDGPLVQEQKSAAEDKEIIEIDLSQSQKKTGKEKTIENFIPAGAFSEIVLLSGLDAPTGGAAQSDPLPVLLKVQNFAQLPNSFKGNIKDCHVVGAAYGSMSAERGYIRLEKLSCILMDKKVIETKIQGYVAGEDGKAGFRGRVVSKQGALIAKAAMAGIFSGMGDAISSQYKTLSQSPLGSFTTVDPKKVAEAGLGEGAGTALNKIADFYIARANETFPIIEIDAGRIGEIILTNGSEFEYSLGEIEQ